MIGISWYEKIIFVFRSGKWIKRMKLFILRRLFYDEWNICVKKFEMTKKSLFNCDLTCQGIFVIEIRRKKMMMYLLFNKKKKR
jgi:hypothetical protein